MENESRTSDYHSDRYRDSFVAAREMAKRVGHIPESRDDALTWASQDTHAAQLLRRRY